MTAGERAAASARICDAANVVLASRVASSEVVALYSAKGSEVETVRLDGYARERGLVVVYPRVETGRLLTFCAATVDELVPAQFGLREPPAGAAEVALAEIAAFVVPGLAFDRAGGRIGWGRGHYDATFAAAPGALRVGLAYERQLIERVAREAHDVALHIIITEVATHVVA